MGSGRVNVGGGTVTDDATATNIDILQGKTAYARGEKLTGTYVPLNTQDATATAADILKGKTAYAQDRKLTGTLDVSSTINGTKKDYYVYQSVTVSAGDFITFVSGVAGTGTGGEANPANVNATPLSDINAARYMDKEKALTPAQNLLGVCAQCMLSETSYVIVFTDLFRLFGYHSDSLHTADYGYFKTSATVLTVNGTTITTSPTVVLDAQVKVSGCGRPGDANNMESFQKNSLSENSQSYYQARETGWIGYTYHIDKVSATQCIFLMCFNNFTLNANKGNEYSATNPTKMYFFFLTVSGSTLVLNGRTEFDTVSTSKYNSIAPTKGGVLKVLNTTQLAIIVTSRADFHLWFAEDGYNSYSIKGCGEAAIMYMTYNFSARTVSVQSYVDIGVPNSVCFEIFDNHIVAVGNVNPVSGTVTAANNPLKNYKFYCISFDASKNVRKQTEVVIDVYTTSGCTFAEAMHSFSSGTNARYPEPSYIYYQPTSSIDIQKLSNQYYVVAMCGYEWIDSRYSYMKGWGEAVFVIDVTTNKVTPNTALKQTFCSKSYLESETSSSIYDWVGDTWHAKVVSDGESNCGVIVCKKGYMHFTNSGGTLTVKPLVVFDLSQFFNTKYQGKKSVSSSSDTSYTNNGYKNSGSYKIDNKDVFGRKNALRAFQTSSFFLFFYEYFIDTGRSSRLQEYWSELNIIRCVKLGFTSSGVGYSSFINETQVKKATAYTNINGVAITGGTGGTSTSHNQKVTVMSLTPP